MYMSPLELAVGYLVMNVSEKPGTEAVDHLRELIQAVWIESSVQTSRQYEGSNRSAKDVIIPAFKMPESIVHL